jgi:hypothetical protein
MKRYGRPPRNRLRCTAKWKHPTRKQRTVTALQKHFLSSLLLTTRLSNWQPYTTQELGTCLLDHLSRYGHAYNFAHSFDTIQALDDTSIDFDLGLHPVSPDHSFLATIDRLSDGAQCLDDNITRLVGYYESTSKEPPLIFDSGASTIITPLRSDFIQFRPTSSRINGLTGGAEITGEGTVRWTVYDDKGTCQHLDTYAKKLVPSAEVRLFSPIPYFRTPANRTKGGAFCLNEAGAQFIFPGVCPAVISMPLTHNVLPQAVLRRRDNNLFTTDTALLSTVLDPTNTHLTASQKELLLWHQRLGHNGMQRIQEQFRPRSDHSPRLPTLHSTVSSCVIPRCDACLLSKASRRSNHAKTAINNPDAAQALTRKSLVPGDTVSVDQYESRLRGRLSTSFGKEPEHDKYGGGTIFIDHYTHYVFAHHQPTLGGGDTLQAKARFEYLARSHGITIHAYHGDNGIFKSHHWMEHCRARRQTNTFSGSGTHHQNGVAERAIRTIVESARTMLLHAMVHWPEATSVDLWPLAFDYAVMLHNYLPTKGSPFTANELFTGTLDSPGFLQNAKVWGCPCYVLDPTLQEGHKLPKWVPRARRGQFLGYSPTHASSVGLVKNLRTGSITPQYHIVCDELFTTIHGTADSTVPSTCENLLTLSHLDALDDDTIGPPLHKDWLTEAETIALRNRSTPKGILRGVSTVPLPACASPPLGVCFTEREHDSIDSRERESRDSITHNDYQAPPAPFSVSTHTTPASTPSRSVHSTTSSIPSSPATPIVVHDDLPVARRLPHRAARDREYRGSSSTYQRICLGNVPTSTYHTFIQQQNDAFLASMPARTRRTHQLSIYTCYHEDNLNLDGNYLDDLHPAAFTAKANSQDSPTYNEAMTGPHRLSFIQAMKEEITQLIGMDCWDEILRPEGKNVLKGTWVFKCKRFPDGSFRKFKARFCVRGDMQIEGVDFFETYSPVVAWSTVRLLLTLSVHLGWESKQVDYTLAFVHAILEDEVYCEMPAQFTKTGYVLRLKRSLYGLRQSPLNFYKRLSSALQARGLKQSENNDPCLFIGRNVICVCFVDDCLFFSTKTTYIDVILTELQDKSRDDALVLNIEDDVAGFLGILLEKQSNGSIELKQTGLIDRIIRIMGLDEAHCRKTLAESSPLGADKEGEVCEEDWNYASIVGMLMYLSANSRPDIAFAVHQAARFTLS